MAIHQCIECGKDTKIRWNGGKCWECHDAGCLFPLPTSGVAPHRNFDPDYAGERWDEED